MFFKGSMRILLVLLHDFPEFLAEYHHSLIEAIPPHCIQFRNVILSAFPRNHSLPDPFTYSFVDGDLDKHRIPNVLSDYSSVLQSRDLRAALEDCVFSDRSIGALVPALRQRIAIHADGDGASPVVKYNLSFLNAVVLYAGSSAVQVTCDAQGLANFEFDPAAPIIKLFEQLAADPDHESESCLLGLSLTHEPLLTQCSVSPFSRVFRPVQLDLVNREPGPVPERAHVVLLAPAPPPVRPNALTLRGRPSRPVDEQAARGYHPRPPRASRRRAPAAVGSDCDVHRIAEAAVLLAPRVHKELAGAHRSLQGLRRLGRS